MRSAARRFLRPKKRRWARSLRRPLSWLRAGLLEPARWRISDWRVGRQTEAAVKPKRWRSRRPGVTVLVISAYLGAGLLVLWLARAVYVVFFRRKAWGFPVDPDSACRVTGVSCGAVTGFLTPLLSVALATAVFLFWRLGKVRRSYVKKAKQEPHSLVQTAGSLIGDELVGRDDLCVAVADNVRDREGRRPHIIMGGVGTGKTATLVELTRILAQQGAVPVPIRLRDANRRDLDFEDLASQRFQAEVYRLVLNRGEAEKVWRQLRKDDKVVVIADGLEEALIDDPDRDNLIRLGVQRAHERGLPLIIASRPHGALRASGATIMELEPLSEESALAFLLKGHEEQQDRLHWIVETAGVSAVPIYLQITRQLCDTDRLKYVARGATDVVDPRNLDQSGLRENLLATWMQAIISGHLYGELAVNKEDRKAAIEQLSALACIALQKDELEIPFADFDCSLARPAGHDNDASPPSAELCGEVRQRITRLQWQEGIDLQLAASMGSLLGLVETDKNGVRFLHSLVQAYLGSRLIGVAWQNDDFRGEITRIKASPVPSVEPGTEPLTEGLISEKLGPEVVAAEVLGTELVRTEDLGIDQGRAGGSVGRELLVSLVLRSRAENRSRLATRRVLPPSGSSVPRAQAAPGSGRDVRDDLKVAASRRQDVSGLDMYAAALEIDSVHPAPNHGEIAKDLAERWSEFRSTDQRTLEEAKLGVVRRFGESARELSRRRSDQGLTNTDICPPAYEHLFGIGFKRIAQERYSSYAVRHAIALEIGAGGVDAFRALWPDLLAKWPELLAKWDRQPPERSSTDSTEEQYKNILMAWLAPLMASTVLGNRQLDREEELQEKATENLDKWVEAVSSQDRSLSRQIALAQGFKYAANCGPRSVHASVDSRTFLIEQASELLKRSEFWFVQLTLLHALTLWKLYDNVATGDDSRARKVRAPHWRAHPRDLMEYWIGIAGTASRPRGSVSESGQGQGSTHPFVAEAARLAVRALETNQPERFIWIDESGVVSKIGSRSMAGFPLRLRRSWIPPSTGWAALDPGAQQLVADVLLLLNLAERGQRPADVERRLERANRSRLPPCITAERRWLDPTRTVGAATSSEPGTNCKSGCPFQLCPYPPKGTQSYREEFSEAFCRRQETLLGRLERKSAPWHDMLRGELRPFWSEMAKRARR